MTPSQNPISKWILVVSALFAIMELMVSFAICFAPESVAENVDLNAKGVDYLIYMWGARQFALGFIFAFATLKKSVPMLTISYVFFLVMFAGDFLIGISQKESSMMIAAVVMCAISSLMLIALNRKNARLKN